jgi:HEAT repeat protein
MYYGRGPMTEGNPELDLRPDESDRPMIEALDAAKRRGDVDYLIDGLRNPKLRFYAINLLGDLRSPKAVPHLIPLLHAGQRATRSSAADSLARIGARDAVPEILDRLEVEADFAPRSWMISALGRLKDQRAYAPLVALLDDEDVRIRLAATRALGMLGNPDAIRPLQRAARREGWRNRRRMKRAIRDLRDNTPDIANPS